MPGGKGRESKSLSVREEDALSSVAFSSYFYNLTGQEIFSKAAKTKKQKATSPKHPTESVRAWSELLGQNHNVRATRPTTAEMAAAEATQESIDEFVEVSTQPTPTLQTDFVHFFPGRHNAADTIRASPIVAAWGARSRRLN